MGERNNKNRWEYFMEIKLGDKFKYYQSSVLYLGDIGKKDKYQAMAIYNKDVKP